MDEELDAGSGVGSPDGDVEHGSVDAEGDLAGFVDAVGADPGLRCGVGAGGAGLGGGAVGRERGAALQGAVWALLVVLGDERVEQ